jgi:aspartate-semialdehyde dehydrogenase
VALDIVDNVIPYIPKEEEKVETETQKILGKVQGDAVVPAPISVSCTCTRVNVLEGHTESVFVQLRRQARLEDVKAVWREFVPGLRLLIATLVEQRVRGLGKRPEREHERRACPSYCTPASPGALKRAGARVAGSNQSGRVPATAAATSSPTAALADMPEPPSPDT